MTRRLVGLLRVEQDQVADAAQLVLLLGEPKARGRRLLGLDLGAQRIGVGLQGAQRVGDVLEGRQHGALVLRGRALIGRDRGLALMVEPGAVDDRLGDAEPDAPHARARHEQRAEAASR